MQLADSDARVTECNKNHHAASYECLRLSGMDLADSTGNTTPSKHDAEPTAALVDDHSSILYEVHRRPRRFSYSSNITHASEHSGASTPTASTSTCLSRPRSASREAERAAAAQSYKSRLARVDRVVLLDHEQEGRLRILTLEEDIVVHYLYPYYQLLHERLRECQSPSPAGLRSEQASVETRQSEPLHGSSSSCHRSLQGDAPHLSVAVPSVPPAEHSNLPNVSERAVVTATAEAQTEEGVRFFSPFASLSGLSTAAVGEERTATPDTSPATGRESAASASPGGRRSLGDADQDNGILMSGKVNAHDQPAPEYRCRDDDDKGCTGAARASEGSSATRCSSKPRGPLLSFLSFTRQVFLRTAEMMWLEMYHHGEETPPASALPDLTDQMGKEEEKEKEEEETADTRVAEDALPGGLIETLAVTSHERGVVADVVEPRRGLHAELSRAASESAGRVGETFQKARFDDGDDSSFSAANSTMSLLHTSSLSCADSQRATTESASAGSSASGRSSSISSRTSIDVALGGQSTRTGNAVGLTEEDVAVELAASTLSVAELAATCVPRSASAPFDRLGLQQERGVGVAAEKEEQHGGRHDDAGNQSTDCGKPACLKGEEEVSNSWLCAAPSPNSGAAIPVKKLSPATSVDCGLASAAHDSPSPRVLFRAATHEAYQDLGRGVSGNSNVSATVSQQHSLHVTSDGPPPYIRHSPSSQQHHGDDRDDGSSDQGHSALVPRHTQQPAFHVGVSPSPSHFHELRTPSRDRSYATSSRSATPCFVGSFSALQAEESVRRAELWATEYYEWSHYLLPASVGNGL